MRGARMNPSEQDLTDLIPAVRKVLHGEHVPADQLDDLAQETIARLIEVRERLESPTAAAYALATARNLARSERRKLQTAERNRPKMPPDLAVPDPLEAVLAQEQEAAIRAALRELPASVRRDLLSQPTLRSTEPAEAARRARLARARARARVEYVLAYRRVKVPSQRCYAVLIAISASDRRRQAALGAGQHLLDCPVCASLVPPLIARRRGLAALIPLPLAMWTIRRPQVGRRRTVAASATVTTALAIAAAALGATTLHERAAANAQLVSVSRGTRVESSPEQVENVTFGPGGISLEVAGPAVSPLVGGAGFGPRPQTFGNANLAGTVLFRSGSAAVDRDGLAVLRAAAAILRQRGTTAVTITGYTDDAADGTGINAQLSAERASAVGKLLQSLDPTVDISLAAAASTEPVASNATADGQAANRRVDITMSS